MCSAVLHAPHLTTDPRWRLFFSHYLPLWLIFPESGFSFQSPFSPGDLHPWSLHHPPAPPLQSQGMAVSPSTAPHTLTQRKSIKMKVKNHWQKRGSYHQQTPCRVYQLGLSLTRDKNSNMYDWVPLLSTWNHHNIVNRLYVNKKFKDFLKRNSK